MKESIVEKNTIMPDGRPFFAWENELEILRRNLKNVKGEIHDAITFRQIAGVVYKHWQEPQDLDWHFRLKQIDAVTAPDFKYNLEKYLNKEPLSKS